MTETDDSTSALLKWYEDYARPFLIGHLPEAKVHDFDKHRDRLARTAKLSDTELSVCFLGNSGVGKSTLINAVIGGAESVVPSGGVGPLTAQALVVRHSDNSRFEVEYHSAVQVLRTVFGLEQMYRAELGTVVGPQDDLAGVEELEEADLVLFEPDADVANIEASASEQLRLERREHLRRRAQLLVTGNQDGKRELKYLLDCLREAAGGKRLWGTELDARDAHRTQQIQHALALSKRKLGHRASASQDANFKKALHDHATGFLAPLIKSLDLYWNAPVLKHGITLVDLPGVGVMRDVHRDVTRHWIREKANALVIIVDHRGLHESVAEALRQSEFLNSLLYSADEPDDDPVLMVAVTRIDDIANERYYQDRTKRKREHFLEVAQEALEKIRNEMRRSLEAIWLTGDDIPEGRRKVAKNLLDRLQVHPVSAPEYCRMLADDADDRSFLGNVDESGVPGFIGSLGSMAAERRANAKQSLENQRSLFSERVFTTLRLIEGQWESDSRAEEEGEKLRQELDLFMLPLRKELHVRQGAYRTFLKRTVPHRIDDLLETASLRASVQIDKYLMRLGSAHWATLRASVKRGGRYSGASEINLPSEFALKFEEPVAEVWGKEILKDIRRETKEYASDCVQLVEQAAAWALEQGARVQPKVVEAQRDAIRIDGKKLESVGHEMVKEMRDEAKAQLINRIEAPIRRKCDVFVRRNLHVGPGVKTRILELYSTLAEEVTEAAREPATQILQQLFKEVEKEILDAFKDHENPLEAVAEAIVASQESYIKRSDAQKRRRVFEDLTVVLDAIPASHPTMAAV
jgi:GTP-binding protein EngB required for normal cell division